MTDFKIFILIHYKNIFKKLCLLDHGTKNICSHKRDAEQTNSALVEAYGTAHKS
jgi:hypothetical protein